MASSDILGFMHSPNPFSSASVAEASFSTESVCAEQFPLAPTLVQQEKVEKFCHPSNPDIKFSHGTTTLGFIFNGGVLIAVDSR